MNVAEEQIEYTIHEVTHAAGVSARTLRNWTNRGLLVAPANQAWATRYNPAYLARACAIQKLREAGWDLDDIPAELDRQDRPPPPAPPAAAVIAELSTRLPPPPSYPSEHWEHIVIVPGLELRVNLRGGQILRKMAQEIYSQYGPAPVSASEAQESDGAV